MSQVFRVPGLSFMCGVATAVLCLALGAAPAIAQDDFHHPELEWRTIETEHFLVHFHNGAERTGRLVAKIAEDVYGPVTSLYGHEPDQKVSFIIKDSDDIANGAAYFYENRIEIYASSMDFDLRGTHNWLRNVVTHEFTHIVQIQTSMKFGRTVPAVYLQWLGYEEERRPDVLYGYPNVIVSYPVSGFLVPAWFAEGVAQYNRRELRYDWWDAHRDMILRSYALDGTMLSWEEMGVFGKSSLGNESAYNAGFAFVSYIGDRYGEEALARISRNLSSFTALTIDGAIEKAVGKSGAELYEEWRDAVERDYVSRTSAVRAAERAGEPLRTGGRHEVVDPGEIQQIETMLRPGIRAERVSLPCCQAAATVGFANLYPRFSPDGKKLAYVSAKGGDYFTLSSLYVYDFEKEEERLVQAGVRTAPAWSPDGGTLYYAKITRDNPHWSLLYDLYAYDLSEEEERRVTHGRRALTPAVSPNGSLLAFVVNRDGTTNLGVCRVDGSDFRLLTRYQNGEQVYNPVWDPGGTRILFDYSVKDGRDIAAVRPDGSGLEFLYPGPQDTRNVTFSPDGGTMYFSSDRTGIFNIYRVAADGGEEEQLTNVTGGAFYPAVSGEGVLVYAAYTPEGYKLTTMKIPGEPVAEGDRYVRTGVPPAVQYGDAVAMVSGGTPEFDWAPLRGYDDSRPPQLTDRPYRSTFTSLSVVPFLRVDNYNTKSRGTDLLKAGVYLFSSDVLDKTGFFAGAAVNPRFERDLFLQFNYRGQVPLLYQLGLEPVASVELYNVTRKTDNRIELPASTIPVDVTYNLLEFDFVLNHRFVSQFSQVEFRYMHSRYTSVIESFVLPEARLIVPGSSDLYLIANTLQLTFLSDAIVPSSTSEINPVGRRIELRVARELNRFNGDGEYELSSTGLRPKYKSINFTRVEARWKEHLPLFFRDHTLTLQVRGGSILGPPVDEFFDFYLGGLVGMKGYPFYAMAGNEMASAGLTYRFPLARHLDIRLFHITFDKLYAAVFADAGDTWTGVRPTLRSFKTDAGAELRLESFSFYSYPTRIFFTAAYGFSRFDRAVRRLDQTVTYGREWRFYFGVLFGFDVD